MRGKYHPVMLMRPACVPVGICVRVRVNAALFTAIVAIVCLP
jgi:hypothetical protein